MAATKRGRAQPKRSKANAPATPLRCRACNGTEAGTEIVDGQEERVRVRLFAHDGPDGRYHYCSDKCLQTFARNWPVTPHTPETERANIVQPMELLDLGAITSDPVLVRHWERSTRSKSGQHGGRSGRGKPKRPHSELIRRAVTLLVEKHQEVSAANVRVLLKSGWEQLALEFGDPLRDLVSVRVREEGPIEIEYTKRWADKHAGKRFIELDAATLSKQIDRAQTLAAK